MARGCGWQGLCVAMAMCGKGGGQEGKHAGEMATGAGGMHPTGMYSCCKLISCNKTAFQ